MKNIEFNKENLGELFDTLRQSDKKELNFYIKNKKEFIKICQLSQKGAYFLADDKNRPLAVGGAKEIDNSTAQLWLLSSKYFYKNRFYLMKYIYSKIEFFKQKYSKLYNYIYFENFDALIWLKKCGFKILDTKDKRFKLFYFNKEENWYTILHL